MPAVLRRVVVVLGLLAACGDNSSPNDQSGPDAGPGGCVALELGDPDFQFNVFGQLTGLRYPVERNLDGAATDYLLVELYDSTTEGLPPLETGTFDLAADPDGDLGTCQHCVWLKVDEGADGSVEWIYYQTEGSMTLDQVSDPLAPLFAGSVSDLVLRRATVTEDGHSVLEGGDDCVAIDSVAFDTSPSPGRACLSAEDCGNPLLEICDPATNQCAPPQCGDFVSCPEAGQVCVSQYHDLFEGACYESCDARVQPGDCADGQRCVQFGVDPSFGLCKTVGDGAAGDACEVEDNGTSCAGKGLCSAVTGTCTSSCSFFDAAPGCADGSLCNLFGVCDPLSAGDDVAVGEACAPDAEIARGCAPDGDAFRGICFAYPPDPTVCEEACLGDLGCEAGEFCALRFSSGLGICRPLPVCGDGERGEINEICDDGNTDSGDGCSGDCQTVEYGVICASLPALAFDTPVAGDTATGLDGFQATCQFGIARAELYEVAPPGPGRLTLRVGSPSQQIVSLRGDCADVGSEAGCEIEDFQGGDAVLVRQVTDAVPAPLTAMVSAATVLEEGPYTVTAEFVPELCGDAIIAGNEVCDDGNTDSLDGCRGDCRAIEYDVYCAQAIPLSTTTEMTGDTTGGPALYDSSCTGTDGATSGPDVLYTYTAPAAGDLHVHLNDFSSNALLVVSVLDACADPSAVNELACRQGFVGGELDVTLAAGQTITVVVDGYFPEEAGTYTLTAAFTPTP